MNSIAFLIDLIVYFQQCNSAYYFGWVWNVCLVNKIATGTGAHHGARVGGVGAAIPGIQGLCPGAALITAKEPKQLMDAKDQKLVILAAENDLEYRLGHIPGARQVDRPANEAPAVTQGGPRQYHRRRRLHHARAKPWHQKGSTIVVYDDKCDATRLWWACLYYGKTDARGIKAWKDSG